MSDSNRFPWRDSDIQRGLMLVRTSNNAHSHINIEILTEKVDDLSLDAKRELRDTLRNAAEVLNLEIAAAETGKHSTNFDWTYVSAAEQNPNSHKLQGWFPSRVLALRHVDSWPAFISNEMRLYTEADASPSALGRPFAAPSDMQGGVCSELYKFLKNNGLQPSRHMNGDSILRALAKDDKTPPICETESAAEDEVTEPFRPPVAVRYIIQEYKLLRGPMLKVVRKEWSDVPGSPPFSDPLDADAHLENLERADLDGDHAYRVKLIK